MSTTTDAGPDYDVEIDADDLLADLAERAAEYGRDYEEKRRWWHESLDTLEPWHEASHWMLEARGGQRAYAEAIAAIQPGGGYRNDDGTVDVHRYMHRLSTFADQCHEDSYGPYAETRQADEAETAYAKILSVLRDEYNIGWPRLDDVGGTPIEEDLP